ncbi:PQQ-dependent sugar dehydrogenase [Cognatishimia sp. WU-CL00825]|uniref:PQQ-dependent sugar dehydrogenase n=1 Tax=Cognatishimia sp. WU-CL00825 TaxID=3127658 RepID=UPI003105EC00
MRPFIIALLFCVFSPVGLRAEAVQTPIGTVQITAMAKGFKTPWALSFLPDGGFLVTERRGRLWHVDPMGTKRRISGTPMVVAEGQGGLLDVLVPRDFATSQHIFLTFVTAQGSGSGTAVARAIFDEKNHQLRDVATIFEMTPGSRGGRHFGSRLAEGPDGALYVTIGERGDRPSAQDLTRHNGSILRIGKTGAVPSDNPFVHRNNAAPEIWSYGHRNPQGMGFDSAGNLWAVEHGARGGDEVNLIKPGANYGWPVIAYGRHYSGGKIGEGTEKTGMRQPDYYWDPSIAPSGLMAYSGEMFPEWRGWIFVGSLKFDYISGLSGTKLKENLALKHSSTKRVRDIRQAADGSIWFISEDRGTIFRISR